ncbi:uncharacterized protein C16orf78 homolog [Leptonychotes weddellii]|uniref:Uncharacterized protein C16orf78 homolog n=1 Tax=Leptonychotes weddellii TaxID=9713 RepID=A0A2U3XG57_LEPWE|nr:uncharacterized protein C16orf78 homolog [Leptonychotes weddellii]
MTEKSEPLKDAMPTERKSTWRTAEERRMSDLTRVLEWLERRQGKKRQKPSEQSAKNAVDPKGKRLSIVPSNYKDGPRKSDLDIKDAIALESAQRPLPYRRQSVLDPALQESPVFGGRKSTLLRDWVISRTTEISYERKLKSLMEKGTEPKVELVRMLKPEEVLSCRYLRLSKNNIRTLLKLCKDAGMIVDIHPHMVEGEIDAKKVFAQNPSVAL